MSAAHGHAADSRAGGAGPSRLPRRRSPTLPERRAGRRHGRRRPRPGMGQARLRERPARRSAFDGGQPARGAGRQRCGASGAVGVRQRRRRTPCRSTSPRPTSSSSSGRAGQADRRGVREQPNRAAERWPDQRQASAIQPAIYKLKLNYTSGAPIAFRDQGLATFDTAAAARRRRAAPNLQPELQRTLQIERSLKTAGELTDLRLAAPAGRGAEPGRRPADRHASTASFPRPAPTTTSWPYRAATPLDRRSSPTLRAGLHGRRRQGAKPGGAGAHPRPDRPASQGAQAVERAERRRLRRGAEAVPKRRPCSPRRPKAAPTALAVDRAVRRRWTAAEGRRRCLRTAPPAARLHGAGRRRRPGRLAIAPARISARCRRSRGRDERAGSRRWPPGRSAGTGRRRAARGRRRPAPKPDPADLGRHRQAVRLDRAPAASVAEEGKARAEPRPVGVRQPAEVRGRPGRQARRWPASGRRATQAQAPAALRR